MTMSFGVATLGPDERFDEEELFASADAALYRAKSSGRDRVCIDGVRRTRRPRSPEGDPAAEAPGL